VRTFPDADLSSAKANEEVLEMLWLCQETEEERTTPIFLKETGGETRGGKRVREKESQREEAFGGDPS